MRIPKEVVETIWKNHHSKITRMLFPDGEDEAVFLHGGPGFCAYLRVNGEMFEADFIISDDLRLSDDNAATKSIAIAVRSGGFPELSAALPHRPESAATCSTCKGTGFVDFGNHPQFLVCHECNGLGWKSG